MALPEPDVEYLARRGVQHELTVEGAMTCVVLPRWALPHGLSLSSADLLIRLQPGYPDLAPDMWWFSPAVLLANGQHIPNTDVTETYLGRQWQRWSRHFQNGQWQGGVDGLESYLTLIDRELERYAQGAA